MSPDKESTVSTATLIAVSIGLVCVIIRYLWQILQHLKYAYNFRKPLRYKHIEVIENVKDCHRIVATLKRHCNEYRVLGFDCEWVTFESQRQPTAMLQLASHRGLCALIRLCSLQSIPMNLKELLKDDNVVKVGIGPHDDADKLAHDYGIDVASTFDLRYLAVLANQKPEGLAKMSKSILNVHLDKNWRLVCSDWEAKTLTAAQLEYAAKDAMVAVEIFKKMSNMLKMRRFWQSPNSNLEHVLQQCDPFIEMRFKDSFLKNGVLMGNASKEETSANTVGKMLSSRAISTRSKTLSPNCLLEAADGEVLCTSDRKKAQWYVDQNLGFEIKPAPYTGGLNFEPGGGAVCIGERYYPTLKDNQCVVCGRRDAYIPMTVVPREYRKHFPVLCPQCYQFRVATRRVETCVQPWPSPP